ncbi:MAG: hypothetical protein QOH49_4954 [Acidobacteriota bacterium]|jgi:hypothetical protein|nr:hypothetical protein [Acidobacteriota bacterium]
MNRILALQKLEVKEEAQGKFFESIASVACSARSIGGCDAQTLPPLMKLAELAEKE